MAAGQGPDAGKRFEETQARADERQSGGISTGTEQISQEARSRTGWIIVGVGIALLAGVAYVVLGPIPGVAVVLLLLIGIVLYRLYRRMFP